MISKLYVLKRLWNSIVVKRLWLHLGMKGCSGTAGSVLALVTISRSAQLKEIFGRQFLFLQVKPDVEPQMLSSKEAVPDRNNNIPESVNKLQYGKQKRKRLEYEVTDQTEHSRQPRTIDIITIERGKKFGGEAIRFNRNQAPSYQYGQQQMYVISSTGINVKTTDYGGKRSKWSARTAEGKNMLTLRLLQGLRVLYLARVENCEKLFFNLIWILLK